MNCMSCRWYDVIRDNHEHTVAICVCRESELFLKQVDIAFDGCDNGIQDDEEEEE